MQYYACQNGGGGGGLGVAEILMFMRSASLAINSAPVICNCCFTPTPEQDGDIHSLVNVLVFTFTLSPQCGGNVGV